MSTISILKEKIRAGDMRKHCFEVSNDCKQCIHYNECVTNLNDPIFRGNYILVNKYRQLKETDILAAALILALVLDFC